MDNGQKPLKHVPLRTCIATRTRQPASDLLRCVAVADSDGVVRILPDPDGTMPGRGGWITPTPEAWEVANQRRAFARALKVSAKIVDAGPVRDYVASLGT